MVNILDKLKNKAYAFLWTIAAKKGAKKAAAVLIAWVSSLPLGDYGVNVSFEEAAVVAGISALLEVGRNYAKHKWGVKGL